MKSLYVERPKYRNKTGSCLAKHWHQSILEADECSSLYLRQKAGEVISYEIQKRFEFVVNGHKICSHLVDFYVIYSDGSIAVVETKGMETELWRIKKKLFEACFPDIPYLVKRAKPNDFFTRNKRRVGYGWK